MAGVMADVSRPASGAPSPLEEGYSTCAAIVESGRGRPSSWRTLDGTVSRTLNQAPSAFYGYAPARRSSADRAILVPE
jgi:hypothetical protein